jgi:prepilin-type processing-associated H-X9-DG protein
MTSFKMPFEIDERAGYNTGTLLVALAGRMNMGLIWQSSESSEPEPPPPQRPFRFSLKHAFMFLTAVCILLALYSAMGFLMLLLVVPIVAIGLVIHGWHSRNPSFLVWGIACGGLSFCLWCWLPVRFHSTSVSSFYFCQSNVGQLGKAVLLHSITRHRLPARNRHLADGTPALSWRVSILPYLGDRPLYESMQHDERWDSPHNSQFINNCPELLRCPNNRNARSETNYFAVGGPDTCWPDKGAIALDEIDDGASNTVMLAEAHGQNVTWSEPKDLDAASMNWQVNTPNGPAISSPHQEQRKTFYVEDVMGWHPTGANVVMADGSVRFLPKNTDPEVVKQLLNRRDGQPR